MFEVFPIVRDLHELLWYLDEALALVAGHPLHGELNLALAQTERLSRQDPDALMELDVAGHRHEANDLLLAASELLREGIRQKKNHRGDDLIGADLEGADLRGASLRGAYVIGANLRGADLRMADVIGADLRDADLSGADLTDCIFLIQSQLDSAKGDCSTSLPPKLTQPTRWSSQG